MKLVVHSTLWKGCCLFILRRICKRLPQSEDAARLLELDAQAEAGVPQEINIPVPPEDVDAMPRADAVVTDAPQEPAKPADPPTAKKTNKADDEFLAGLGD